MMRVLIIDDERLARKELKSLLTELDLVEVLDECSNADDALEKIEALKPDLIFLDIQMPGKDGFALLEELSFVPKVIFTTAYDEYALKAFDVNAFDYLMKPIEINRLKESLEQLITENAEIKQVEKPKELTHKFDAEEQVFLKDGDKCWFVKLKDISLFESEGNYVRVYFDKNKPLILKSLNNLEERLDNRVFFRANRKYIINLNWIDSVESWFNGGLLAKLSTGMQVEISRRQAAKLKDMMSL
ncbi:LytTR family DNA-binding domain-containing protein [Vicingaceae bacterium]|jgi:two-component system, LytTR family, response regulator|nr:LytTR family DNA-binding domain-containing protein [Vicingaceae bacterium]